MCSFPHLRRHPADGHPFSAPSPSSGKGVLFETRTHLSYTCVCYVGWRNTDDIACKAEDRVSFALMSGFPFFPERNVCVDFVHAVHRLMPRTG